MTKIQGESVLVHLVMRSSNSSLSGIVHISWLPSLFPLHENYGRARFHRDRVRRTHASDHSRPVPRKEGIGS